MDKASFIDAAKSVRRSGWETHMQNGVGIFPIGYDSRATLLSSPPRSVDFCRHASAPAFALVAKLDFAVLVWAVGVNNPASEVQTHPQLPPFPKGCINNMSGFKAKKQIFND